MSPGLWDVFHDVSTAVLVLTVFITMDTVRRLQQRVRTLEKKVVQQSGEKPTE